MHAAIALVQRAECPEGGLHPPVDHSDWFRLVEHYRGALGCALLAPAYNKAGLQWKQAALSGSHFKFITNVGVEQVEASIARDEEYLSERLTRRSRGLSRGFRQDNKGNQP
jgi:hypothetical protein